MDKDNQELRAALNDAEAFISEILAKEILSHGVEIKRQQLSARLKGIKDSICRPETDAVPPRPPKAVSNVTDKPDSNEEEDIYDDTLTEEATPESPSYYVMNAEGVPTSSDMVKPSDQQPQNYEFMEGTGEGAAVDDPAYDVADLEENYDVPEQEKTKEEGDNSKPMDIEVTGDKENSGQSATADIGDDMYEGIEPQDSPAMEVPHTQPSTLTVPPRKDRSVTHDIENLTIPKKAAEVENVIYKGFLHKHRKKGLYYIGSKWQRRYCVVRDFVVYYYKDDHADRQKGTIILPGYTIEPSTRSKKEFMLTRENDRTYLFMADTAEEAEKWMQAMREGAGAELSKRQSELLSDLRLQEHDGDEDSLTYDDTAGNGTKSSDNEDFRETVADGPEEVYDDIASEEQFPEYEVADLPSSPANKAEAGPLSDEFYETTGNSDDEQPQAMDETYDPVEDIGGEPSTPLVEDFYETTDDAPSPPPQPARPPKKSQTPEARPPKQGALPPKPGFPPPREGGLPPTPPAADDEYDLVGDEKIENLPEPILEDDDMYDLVETEKQPLPPPPPPLQDAEYEVAENTPPRPGHKPGTPHVKPAAQDTKPAIPGKPFVPQKPSTPSPPSKRQPPLAPPSEGKGVGKPPLPVPPRGNTTKPPMPTPPRDDSHGKPPLPTPPGEIQANKTPSTPPKPHVGKPPMPTPKETPREPPSDQEINLANIYQAKWDVKADNEDELEFNRGDLIYIYGKANSDWWVGSKYKPQGYSIKLVPSNYIMEAYML